jgi:putative peptidoglycan lipid II flippase
MVADSLVPLVARAFYALSDTRTPALVAIGSVVLNLFLLIIFTRYGLAGIGLAYVVSRVLSLSALFGLLGKKMGNLGAAYIMQGAWRMLFASVLSGAAAYATLRFMAPQVDMHTFVGIFAQGITAGGVGVLSYLMLVLTWKLPEVNFVKRWLISAWRLSLHLVRG